MNYAPSLIDRILSRIEQQELRSLQWGFVNGSLGEEELHALIQEVLDEAEESFDPGDLVEELIEQHMLFEQQREDGYRYRTRFAEGVRLLSTLRQLFPGKPWLSAPELVSDYRVDARPRTFPRRDIPKADVLEALSGTPGWSPLHHALCGGLLLDKYKLAAFQVRAAQQILKGGDFDRGVVVSAGTGSGKTLAFYLPALLEIGTLVQPNQYWVKGVALYPRIELLKDQFNEAYKMARRVDDVLAHHKRRPIRMGPFFSLTPTDATVQAVEQARWSVAGGGYVCPFLSCPECEDDLIWRKSDLDQRVERLVCRKGSKCSGTVTGDEVALTRRSMRDHPPDLVFTTTEMLNQRLSDRAHRHLFGVTPRRDQRLRYVLLDEVHTYESSSGAQTALVLRRWRHAVRAPLRFVGLSATLREAPQFFADLVGIDAEAVFEAAPGTDEMEQRSMLYQVILRGNPASQAQILSTTIQANFLLARLLDPVSTPGGSQPDSYGFHGSRLFAFTDDLDVTNRLFDSLRDAEGYDIFGRPDPKKTVLASLRESGRPDGLSRDRAGQNWRAVEAIGHPLGAGNRLRITRTSSQDAGVDRTSNVIVATASLEVGFNDPTVGAVLQHKSPHGMAAYLQRKGRAGRSQAMRPWVVTVLSDFGRDRLTYQAYDQLFDPVLTAQRLPVRNRYIIRMQAVSAFIEWLAESLPGVGRNWMWRVLNEPAGGKDLIELEQKQVIQRLEALLRGDGALLEQLTAHLRGALRLDSEDDLAAILWEAPRSLMMEVIPTLLRRLQTQWQTHPQLGGGSDIRAGGIRVHPLPDFLPATLFSPLNVPDVAIVIPPATVKHEERTESLGIVQALNILTPGRITRRFAPERGGLYHWVRVPLTLDEHMLPVTRYAEQLELVAHVPDAKRAGGLIPLYRPWKVRLERALEREVSPTSMALLSWEFEVVPSGKPASVMIGHTARWGGALSKAAFYLHNFRSPVITRRYAMEATATIRRPGEPDPMTIQTRFTTDDGHPAAVGFEQTVDGLRVELKLPDRATLLERVGRSPNLPAWRAAFFRDLILGDPDLSVEANFFQRDWLSQLYLSALVARAIEAGVTLRDACEQLHQRGLQEAFAMAMDSIFQIDPGAEADPDADLGSETESDELSPVRQARPTLRERLAELLAHPGVQARLQTLASSLWAPDLRQWGDWLASRIAGTMGEAALQACQHVAPSFVSSDSLLVDVMAEPAETEGGERTYSLWVTEATMGGAGAMEAIAGETVGNPRVFLSALEAALAPGDLEAVSAGLEAFARLTQTDSAIAAAAEALRLEERHAEHQAQFQAMVSLLAHRGLAIDRSLAVALHQRLLRQGTGAESDRLVCDLLDYWHESQASLGVAFDLRLFCYLAVSAPTFADRVKKLVSHNTGTVLSPADRVSALSGFLWPQAAEQRGRTLQSYSPFHQPGWTDPSLVRDLILANKVRTIALSAQDWRERLQATLAESGLVRLQADHDQEQLLQQVLIQLLAEPMSVDYLQFFVVIEQVQRDDKSSTVTLTLKEIM